MSIRIAQAADVAAIISVINAAFRRAESFFIERDRIDAATVGELMGSGEFLVFEGESEIAGCVYVEARRQRSYAGLLAVEPSRQQSGLGRRLMTAAEDRGRELGCRFMDLRIVNLRKELPGFYHRLGYVETGSTPFTAGVPTKIPCHFITMSKPLLRENP